MVECSCIIQVKHQYYKQVFGRVYYLYLIYRKIYILASELGNIVASIAPISGSPLLGFNHMPDTAMSVIDFHGTDDSVIPYDIYR